MKKQSKKSTRYNWVKLQNEFDKYKLKNRDKSLKDFCTLKQIPYTQARNNLTVAKALQKACIFDSAKNEGFTKTLRRNGLSKGINEALKHEQQTVMIDTLFMSLWERVSKELNTKNTLKTFEALKGITALVKSKVELTRVELTRQSMKHIGALEEENEKIKEEEKSFFSDMLNEIKREVNTEADIKAQIESLELKLKGIQQEEQSKDNETECK